MIYSILSYGNPILKKPTKDIDQKLKTDFLGLGEKFKLMEKQYEDINKGTFEKPKIKPKGSLSDGTTYEYFKNRNWNVFTSEPGRFVVTYPDGSTEKLTYTEFITKYGSELPNIIQKNDTQMNNENDENKDLSFLYKNMNFSYTSPFMTEGLKFNYKDLDLGLLNDIDFVNMDNTKTVFVTQRFIVPQK